ncbi:MAG: S-adenosyl-l-methionine hydroxide adenosyltransferase family protein [Bacteroidota bacterium]
MNLPIITLTSDLGATDHYVAALKGGLLCRTQDFQWIDISNQIKPFDVFTGAHVLNEAYRFFPPGSLHLLLIGNGESEGANSYAPTANENIRLLIAKYREHYFISFDNGALSLIFDDLPDQLHALPIAKEDYGNTFIALHILPGLIAGMIASGLRELPGTSTEKYVTRSFLSGFSDKDSIRGVITHIDYFGNAISDLHREQFLLAAAGRKASVIHKKTVFSEILKSFAQQTRGREIALFNSLGYLELCVKDGSAEEMLGIRKNDSFIIQFT